MNIALLGYGKMGKEIESIALQRNHNIPLIIDVNNAEEFNAENLKKVDVAIDFTIPESAYGNIMKCFENNVPVVCGTTGWLNKFDEVKDSCTKNNQSFFYASNYSVGVNIFFKLNEYLARMMNNFSQYHVNIEETHHTQKLDAPSGTAITIAEGIIDNYSKKSWKLDNENPGNDDIPITAIRRDAVPGIHSVFYDSNVDFIEIKHSAKSRQGFALGAVTAAEFIHDKKGFFTMDDLLNLK